jgi:glucose/mannose-6-phosphate isomerase
VSGSLEPPYGERDAFGMAPRIDGQPEQIEEALARGAREPWRVPRRPPALLAVGAMGGSAIAADLTAALYRDRLPRPLLVVRDYRWPACVDRDAVALLCSYSGNTEETLALFREAGEIGVPRLALTTGGRLADECREHGVACATLPAGSPPRAAVFSCWVAITRLLHALGWADDPAAAWSEAAAALRAGRETLGPGSLERDNPVKRLARALAGRSLFVYAGSETLGAAATRVRTQLNENAKLLAHSALVPELNHNEIVGWERPGDTRRPVAVLVLRDREDTPFVARRLTLTAEYAQRQGAEVHEVSSGDGGRLARMASLVQWGDYLSLYLALHSGVDPTPIASIDEFKRRLAEVER